MRMMSDAGGSLTPLGTILLDTSLCIHSYYIVQWHNLCTFSHNTSKRNVVPIQIVEGQMASLLWAHYCTFTSSHPPKILSLALNIKTAIAYNQETATQTNARE